jgi:hypothetical protein
LSATGAKPRAARNGSQSAKHGGVGEVAVQQQHGSPAGRLAAIRSVVRLPMRAVSSIAVPCLESALL